MKSQGLHFCSHLLAVPNLLENIRYEMNDWYNRSTINSPAGGAAGVRYRRMKKLADVSVEALAKKEHTASLEC